MEPDFAVEQRALAAVSWQLIAVREQLAAPNAWLRRTIFGVDAVVQSFGGELRAYENVCAHRGFPLRTEDAGAGPLQCGFHGWVYNRAGVPTGIPRNTELFQLARERRHELALRPIRIAEIGRFVFATTSAEAPPLDDYLGPYAEVYRVLDASIGPLLGTFRLRSRANWKRHAEITLDDYHLESIHPGSFGATPSPAYKFVYRRDGRHSCLMRRRDPTWSFDGFWADLARGAYDRTGYKIFNSFPGTAIGTTREGCSASALTPLGPRATAIDVFLFLWPDADPGLGPAVMAFNETLYAEDVRACETWQAADPLAHPPVLGVLEERIGWFRETYAECLAR